MAQSSTSSLSFLVSPLFPILCLSVSCLFLVCYLHRKRISDRLARSCPPTSLFAGRLTRWNWKWGYVRIAREDLSAGFSSSRNDDQIELVSSPNSNSSSNNNPTITMTMATPLSKYFDPETSILYRHIREPPSPPPPPSSSSSSSDDNGDVGRGSQPTNQLPVQDLVQSHQRCGYRSLSG